VVNAGDKFQVEALAFCKPPQLAFFSAADLACFIATAHDERVDALFDESVEDLCRPWHGGDPVDAPPPHFAERLGQVPDPHGGSVFSRLAEQPLHHTGEPFVDADELPLGKGTHLSCRPLGCSSPARGLGSLSKRWHLAESSREHRINCHDTTDTEVNAGSDGVVSTGTQAHQDDR
jgi:hypothetical protein